MTAQQTGEFDVLLQPTRFAILRTLVAEDRPLYIEQIAGKTGENPRLISHHLALLEDEGIVSSQFDMIRTDSGRGRGGRFFSVTPKGRSLVRKLGATVDSEFGPKGDG